MKTVQPAPRGLSLNDTLFISDKIGIVGKSELLLRISTLPLIGSSPIKVRDLYLTYKVDFSTLINLVGDKSFNIYMLSLVDNFTSLIDKALVCDRLKDYDNKSPYLSGDNSAFKVNEEGVIIWVDYDNINLHGEELGVNNYA